MKRVTFFLMPVFVLALTATAFAQGGGKPVTTDGDNGETLGITVSGRVNFEFVFREGETSFVRDNSATPENDSTTSIEGEIHLQFDIELNDKISARISLRTRRLNDGGLGFAFGTNSETTTPIFDEAWVLIADALTEGLNIKVGIIAHRWDPRGIGRSMVFDPRWSSPISGNTGLALDFGAQDELQPTGVMATYTRDNWHLDVFMLPAIVEGGAAKNDEATYGADFWYGLESMGEGSGFGFILLVQPLFGSEATMYTFGGAVDLHGLVEGLELFLEVYFQFGDAATDVDAGGIAFEIGAKYNFSSDMKPWVQLVIDWITGDDGTGLSDADNFIAYESIEDTMVVESQIYGFNVQSNYLAVKLSGGASFSVASGTNNLDLTAILAWFSLDEDIGASNEDALGIEFDVRLTYHLNSQVSTYVGFGILFSSDVLEDVIGSADDDDSTWVGVFGVDLRF